MERVGIDGQLAGLHTRAPRVPLLREEAGLVARRRAVAMRAFDYYQKRRRDLQPDVRELLLQRRLSLLALTWRMSALL